MNEARKDYEQKNQVIYATMKQSNERDMMIAEETISRYTSMQIEHKLAMEEKAQNLVALQEYKSINVLVRTIEGQRDEAIDERDKHYETIKQLESEIKKLQETHS